MDPRPEHALRVANVVRYVTPLREGGSLPALVEADDGGLYVLKFRGAGQGSAALVAEVIGGELARALGLPVPALVQLDLDPALGRTEPDYEIRSLIQSSAGPNLGMAFLPEALPFDPAARPVLDGALAARIVLLDAFVMNVDRTVRNPNLLWSRGALWLIDHGAALYWQHDWDGGLTGSRRPFTPIREHVLLPWADAIDEAAEALVALTPEMVSAAVARVPDDWLGHPPGVTGSAARRAAYVSFLVDRLRAPEVFVAEAEAARRRRRGA